MKIEEIIKEIEKVLAKKYKEIFTCSTSSVKPDKKCQHESTGWNSARFVLLEHFKKILNEKNRDQR